MARLFLTDIDLAGNQLLGLALERLASPPAPPLTAGRVYFDTALGLPRVWTGAVWLALGGQGAAAPAVPPFVQAMPATTWTIAHGLNRYPGVVVVDSAGNAIEPGVNYPDRNTVVLSFSVPTSGTAELDAR